MKKLIAILLAALMLLSVVACTPAVDNKDPENNTDVENQTPDTDVENPDNTTPDGPTDANVTIDPAVEAGTLGEALWNAFMQEMLANEQISMEELANKLITNPAIQFMGGAMPLEAGQEYFTGFGEYKIEGYESGAFYMPMIGSIPFVGYVFKLADGVNAQEFVNNLTANCVPNWNICVTADQTVAGAYNNTVFFLMCPKGLDNGEGGEMGGDSADVYYPDVEDFTVGYDLWNVFENTMMNGTATTAEEIAGAIVEAQMVPFGLGVMPVEPGFLSGFDNYEIGGFTEGAVFMPMIGSIPFVGYILQVEEGIDVVNYVNDLQANANPAWNVCVTADQVVVGAYNNTVFFLMCPASVEA